MKGIACGQSNDMSRRVFIPDRLCDVNFCYVPMVEGGDGISSALDRFGPFFRVSTSIGLYSVDLRSEGVRGSSYRSLSGPMSAMVGCREKSWSAKKIYLSLESEKRPGRI